MAILRAIAVVGVLVICAIPSGSMAQQTRSQGAIEKLGNWLTSDITESLARFMRALNDDPDLAYAGTSGVFQHWVTRQQFREFIAAEVLAGVSDVQWSKKTISAHVGGDRVGTAEGTFVKKDGTIIPLTMALSKQDGQWRVRGVAVAEPQGLEQGRLPSEQSLVRLTNLTMNAFARSINANSMAQFYEYAAVALRDTRSIEQIEKQFGGFLNKSIALPNFVAMSPIFAENPSRNKNGQLVIKGHYLQSPKQFYGFTHEYELEGTGWKLVRFTLDADGTGTRASNVRPQLPTHATCLELAKAATDDFTGSLAAGDMRRLRRGMSVPAQDKLTLDMLNQSFAGFFKNPPELTMLDKTGPTVDPPSMTTRGELVVIATYPTTPRPVAFKLTYVREGLAGMAQGWKLSGISVLLDPDAANKIRKSQ